MQVWQFGMADQFSPATRGTSRRMKPGGRPCFDWTSNQPSRPLTTLTFIPGSISPIRGENSVGAA
jgi:hypothetical protein